MNKIRCRIMHMKNFMDYEIETKVSSEKGFKNFIKKELDKYNLASPRQYRFDLIIDELVAKSQMSYPILDDRFL